MIANIKPGILVALKTSVRGGVAYSRRELDTPEGAPDGTMQRWETTRTIDNPDDYTAAKAIRSMAVSKVRRVCVATDFGLLCPEAKEAALDEAIEDARALVAAHNEDREVRTRVDFYVLKGRVASSDEEAARGIAAEVRGLLEAMDRGVAAGDPAAVREAASRARKLEQVLDDVTAKKVGEAVSEARAAAREITRRVIDGGEALDAVVSEISRERIEAARFTFLDVEPVGEIAEPAAEARVVDDVTTVEAATKRILAQGRQLDFDIRESD